MDMRIVNRVAMGANLVFTLVSVAMYLMGIIANLGTFFASLVVVGFVFVTLVIFDSRVTDNTTLPKPVVVFFYVLSAVFFLLCLCGSIVGGLVADGGGFGNRSVMGAASAFFAFNCFVVAYLVVVFFRAGDGEFSTTNSASSSSSSRLPLALIAAHAVFASLSPMLLMINGARTWQSSFVANAFAAVYLAVAANYLTLFAYRHLVLGIDEEPKLGKLGLVAAALQFAYIIFVAAAQGIYDCIHSPGAYQLPSNITGIVFSILDFFAVLCLSLLLLKKGLPDTQQVAYQPVPQGGGDVAAETTPLRADEQVH